MTGPRRALLGLAAALSLAAPACGGEDAHPDTQETTAISDETQIPSEPLFFATQFKPSVRGGLRIIYTDVRGDEDGAVREAALIVDAPGSPGSETVWVGATPVEHRGYTLTLVRADADFGGVAVLRITDPQGQPVGW